MRAKYCHMIKLSMAVQIKIQYICDKPKMNATFHQARFTIKRERVHVTAGKITFIQNRDVLV